MNKSILKYLFFLFLLSQPLSLLAQAQVRKNIRKGNKAYNEQKFSDAAKLYNDAVKENPKSMEANFNLGNALYKQKDWDKAVEQMNHYLTLQQQDQRQLSAAWHNIGNALLQKKDLQKSMEAYKMALRLNPQDEETRYNLAVVQKMIQDQQQQQQNDKNNDNKDQQQQNQQNQPQQNQNDKQQKPEKQNEPEQMSRDNARQMLQAIEQDEKETQEKVQRIKAEERQQKAEDNRRRNKNW